MMILTNAPKIRVPERVGGVRVHLVQTVAVAPPAMTEITVVMTANVMTASRAIAAATTVHVMISHVMPHRGVPFPAHRVKKHRQKPITAELVVRALSIRKFCAVNAQKKPESMARMPVRPCSRAVRNVSFAPGLSRALRRVSKKPCAGWRQTAKPTMW
ncbi:hypothetical protein D3C72_536290 [compost metagenome]